MAVCDNKALTVLIRQNVEFFTFFDALGVSQYELYADVGEGQQVPDGVLRRDAESIGTFLLSGFFFSIQRVAILHRQTVVVTARHVVAERLPANGELLGFDIDDLQPSRTMHGI